MLLALLVVVVATHLSGSPEPTSPPPQDSTPLVIIGGWSNVPEDFTRAAGNDGDPLVLLSSLGNQLYVAQQDGTILGPTPLGSTANRPILLTRHSNPLGRVEANDLFEAKQIVAFVRKLELKTPAKFDIVGFSMGGLIARSMVSRPAKENVFEGVAKPRNLVTMGTPNFGVNAFVVIGQRLRSPLMVAHSTGSAPDQTGGVNDMKPGSEFLERLNAVQLSPETRVSTIAGEFDLIGELPPHQFDDVRGSCLHLRLEHPEGCELIQTPCFHLRLCPHTPRHPFWICAEHAGHELRLACWHWTQEHDDGETIGQMPCVHPPESDKRVSMGTDGLVRVVSAQLTNAQAANLGQQIVISNLWHTPETKSQAFTASPGLYIDGRNQPADRPLGTGRLLKGVPQDAKWFFSDKRVAQALSEILVP